MKTGERMISANTIGTPAPQREVPETEVAMPGRETAGAIRIGSLLEPVRQIINHPDRNRLMAELFKDYK